MPLFLRRSTTAPRPLHHQIRTFINVKIPWFRDRHLDAAVEKEKNLKALHSLKSLIASQPSQTLPLSTISPLRTQLLLPTTAIKFIQQYPLIFKLFFPPHTRIRLPHVKLTRKALSFHNDEVLILNRSLYRRDVAVRLAKVLMLTGAGKLPLYLVNMVKYDLGLPHDYLLSLLPEFPEFFQICELGEDSNGGGGVLGLELVDWKYDLAVPVLRNGRDRRVRFPINLPSGFYLERRVLEWMEEWQNSPYFSPYENAFHLAPRGDMAERWTVGVIHEFLSLLVSKKIDREVLYSLGEFWGFRQVGIKKAIVHFPGFFYVSNKISVKTVVLREAFRENMLIEKHQLMVMRDRYIFLMNLVLRRGKPIAGLSWHRKGRNPPIEPKKQVDHNIMERGDDD